MGKVFTQVLISLHVTKRGQKNHIKHTERGHEATLIYIRDYDLCDTGIG